MLTRKEIVSSVKDEKWQNFRKNLKGFSTKSKISLLKEWKKKHKNSKKSNIQVQNYLNALARAGQI